MAAWYAAAGPIWDLLSPEMRYRTPWGGGELGEAVENAHHWLLTHPCPDPSVRRHLTAVLDAYAEMPHATVGRVMELREIIAHHAHAVGDQKVQRPTMRSSRR